MTITSVLVDSREPKFVQKADYGVPATVVKLDAGDVWVATGDDELLIIERKTPEDVLGSIGDGRLFNQAKAMIEQSRWSYVVISGALIPDSEGKVNGTGWRYSSVQGALLTVQELGVCVVHCDGRADFAPCVRRLAERERDKIRPLPARQSAALGPGENVLASLPGIGPERALTLLKALPPWSALEFLTDPTWNHESIVGIGDGIKKKVRDALDVPDGYRLTAIPFDEGQGKADE